MRLPFLGPIKPCLFRTCRIGYHINHAAEAAVSPSALPGKPHDVRRSSSL